MQLALQFSAKYIPKQWVHKVPIFITTSRLFSVPFCVPSLSLAPVLAFLFLKSPHLLGTELKVFKALLFPSLSAFSRRRNFYLFCLKGKINRNKWRSHLCEWLDCSSCSSSEEQTPFLMVLSWSDKKAVWNVVPGHLPAWYSSSAKHIVQSIYRLLKSNLSSFMLLCFTRMPLYTVVYKTLVKFNPFTTLHLN